MARSDRQRTNNSQRSLKTVSASYEIVDALFELDGARVTDVADYLGIAKSTAYNHLDTLYKNEILVKKGKEYHVGLKFLDYGGRVRHDLKLSRVSQNQLDQLANDTGEVAWLMTEEHGQAVYLRCSTSEQSVRTSGRVGKRAPIHCVSCGKAILAHLPKHRVDEIIDKHGLKGTRENTITSRSELFDELEEVRREGYAINDEEEVDNIRAIGAPILVNGEPVGAISVAGPVNRLQQGRLKDELPEKVLAASNTIEVKLSHDNY